MSEADERSDISQFDCVVSQENQARVTAMIHKKKKKSGGEEGRRTSKRKGLKCAPDFLLSVGPTFVLLQRDL